MSNDASALAVREMQGPEAAAGAHWPLEWALPALAKGRRTTFWNAQDGIVTLEGLGSSNSHINAHGGHLSRRARLPPPRVCGDWSPAGTRKQGMDPRMSLPREPRQIQPEGCADSSTESSGNKSGDEGQAGGRQQGEVCV